MMRCAVCLLLLGVFAGCAVRGDAPPTPAEHTLELARLVEQIEALYARGKRDAAQAELDRYLPTAGDQPDARALWVQAQLVLDRGDQPGGSQRTAAQHALPWLERAVAANPGWLEPRHQLALSLMEVGRPLAADAVFADVAKLPHHEAVGLYGRAYVASQTNRPAEAVQFLDAALDADPTHQGALQARARIAHSQGDQAKAIELWQRFLQAQPLDPGAYQQLGNAQAGAGLKHDARRSWERSYDLKPNARTAAQLADWFRSEERIEEARSWDQRAGSRDSAAAEPAGIPAPRFK